MKILKILPFLVVVLALLFLVNVARAERIVSDPWITGTDKLPETCEMAKNGGNFSSFPVETVTNGVRCSIPVTGDDFKTVVYSIKACKGVLCSNAIPFEPGKDIPRDPSGLKLLGN